MPFILIAMMMMMIDGNCDNVVDNDDAEIREGDNCDGNESEDSAYEDNRGNDNDDGNDGNNYGLDDVTISDVKHA